MNHAGLSYRSAIAIPRLRSRLSCIYGDKQRLSNERGRAVRPDSRIIHPK
ncbi:MAG: hypothetical protein AB4426_20865 [Xenococcaceae cyanobacterium]